MFKSQVERQTGKKLKTLRSDNGKEYVNFEFDAFLNECGIMRQLTVPYTPQQNGVAERANRTLVEMARTMMLHAGTPKSLWVEAINTAVYLRNRSPTSILGNITPYEVWYGRKPNVNHLRTFGCIAVALNKKQKKNFDARGEEYIMVGYSNVSKAYRLYDKHAHNVVERRDVIFIETQLGGGFCADKNEQASTCIDVREYVLTSREKQQINRSVDNNNVNEDVQA